MLGIGIKAALSAAVWSFDRSSERVDARMTNPGTSSRQPGSDVSKPD